LANSSEPPRGLSFIQARLLDTRGTNRRAFRFPKCPGNLSPAYRKRRFNIAERRIEEWTDLVNHRALRRGGDDGESAQGNSGERDELVARITERSEYGVRGHVLY
jgi:hypothetical protein